MGVSTGGNTGGNTGTQQGASFVLIGSNNITLSQSTAANQINSIYISGGAGAAGNTGYLSAGTQTASLGTVSFLDGSGVSWGLNAQTLTASVKTDYLTSQSNQAVSAANGSYAFQTLSFSNANGISFGTSAGSAITGSYTVPTQTVESQSLGISNLGNTSGTSGIASGAQVRMLFAGGNNVTLSQSLNGASGTITISAFNQTQFVLSEGNGLSFGTNGSTVTGSHNGLTSQSNQALSGSNGSFTFQTATFGSSNGMHFYTTNGSLVGSYTVPSVPAQTNQTIGIYGSSQTTGQSSSSTFDARSLSFRGAGIVSVGASGGEWIISATGGGGGNTGSISAGTTRGTLGEIVFSDSNGVSFGINGQTVTATVATNYLTSQSNQALSGSNGSFTFQTATFGNSNGMHFYTTNGSLVGSYTVPTVTNSAWTVSDAATSGTVARLAFTNLNGVTLSLSSGAGGSHTIVGSHNALTSQSNQALSGSNGSFTFQTATFGNLNGMSFYSSNGSLVGSYTVPSVPAQTNQTLGLYFTSNTTQSSSGTQDARSLTFHGAGIASVGYSNGSVVVSVPAGGGGGYSAGLSNIGNTSGNTGTVSNQLVLAGGNNITLSGSTNAGSMTITISGGAGGGSVNISAGSTSNNLTNFVLSDSNGVFFGLNGSTVTGKNKHLSYWEPYQYLTGQNINNASLYVQPVTISGQIDATQCDMMFRFSNSASAGNSMAFSIGLYTMSGSTASRVSSTSSGVSYNSTMGGSSSATAVNGTRMVSFGLGTWNVTPGEYLFAFWGSSTSALTSGTISVYGRTANTFNGYVHQTNSTSGTYNYFMPGIYSATTNALPATIEVSQVQACGNSVQRQPWFVMRGTR